MLINLRKDAVMLSKELTLVSHRGGKGFGPENTLESLSQALDYGVEMIETDVRMSGDGVPFIRHSPFLGLHLLSNMSMSEIREKEPQIPTLEEYLNLSSQRCSMNLEIKRCQPAILAEIIDLAAPSYPILVSSFDNEFLQEFRQILDWVECGLITQYEPTVDRMMEEAVGCGATTLLPVSYSVRESLVNTAHEAGLRVIAWTVNSRSHLQNMVEVGVDGIITDLYMELKEFLESQTIETRMAGQPILDERSFPS